MRIYWLNFWWGGGAFYGPVLFVLGVLALLAAYSFSLSAYWYECGGLALAVGLCRCAMMPGTESEGGASDFGGDGDGGCD